MKKVVLALLAILISGQMLGTCFAAQVPSNCKLVGNVWRKEDSGWVERTVFRFPGSQEEAVSALKRYFTRSGWSVVSERSQIVFWAPNKSRVPTIKFASGARNATLYVMGLDDAVACWEVSVGKAMPQGTQRIAESLDYSPKGDLNFALSTTTGSWMTAQFAYAGDENVIDQELIRKGYEGGFLGELSGWGASFLWNEFSSAGMSCMGGWHKSWGAEMSYVGVLKLPEDEFFRVTVQRVVGGGEPYETMDEDIGCLFAFAGNWLLEQSLFGGITTPIPGR